jgi:hypothetical protein
MLMADEHDLESVARAALYLLETRQVGAREAAAKMLREALDRRRVPGVERGSWEEEQLWRNFL